MDSDESDDEQYTRKAQRSRRLKPSQSQSQRSIPSQLQSQRSERSIPSQLQSQRSIPSQSQSQSCSAPASSSKKLKANDNRIVHEYLMSAEEMVNNGVLYCLVMQKTKLPLKRNDFVKIVFENQCTNVKLVMKQLEDVLEDAFGLRLLGVNEDLTNANKTVTSYILTSKFFNMTSRHVFNDPLIEIQHSILYMILTTVFMTGHGIEEDTIWKIMTELKLIPSSCTKREDLHRFLKNAYILPLYLDMETISDGNEITRYRYSWGFRSENEFSLYKILKMVSKYFPGTKPVDYANQYTTIMNTPGEKKLALKDEAENFSGDNMEFNYMNDDDANEDGVGSTQS